MREKAHRSIYKGLIEAAREFRKNHRASENTEEG
jgi:hypothetical protein